MLESYKEYITEQLELYPRLEAQVLFHTIEKLGYTGSARTVRRFLATIRPRKFREYKPVKVLPGEQAQVDWGHMGSTVVDGKRRALCAFAITLRWSRAMYFEFITLLNMANFAGCLHRALRRRIDIRRFENHFEVLDGQQTVAQHPFLTGKGKRRILDGHDPHANKSKRSRGLQLHFEELCPEAGEYLQGLSRSTIAPLQ